MLSILTLPKAGVPSREMKPDELPPLLQSPEAITWVRCLAPTDPDLLWLQDTYAFHPLTIEDCRNRNQRPKFEPYDGYVFLVLFTLSWEQDTLETTEIHCFLMARCLITVEDHDSPAIAAVWQRMHQAPDLMQRGADFCFMRSPTRWSIRFLRWLTGSRRVSMRSRSASSRRSQSRCNR